MRHWPQLSSAAKVLPGMFQITFTQPLRVRNLCLSHCSQHLDISWMDLSSQMTSTDIVGMLHPKLVEVLFYKWGIGTSPGIMRPLAPQHGRCGADTILHLFFTDFWPNKPNAFGKRILFVRRSLPNEVGIRHVHHVPTLVVEDVVPQ